MGVHKDKALLDCADPGFSSDRVSLSLGEDKVLSLGTVFAWLYCVISADSARDSLGEDAPWLFAALVA